MGSIVIERTFDGLMLMVLMLLLVVLFPKTHFLGGMALSTGLVFLALAAGITFYSFATEGTHRVIDRILRILPRRFEGFINHRLKSFLHGIRGIWTVEGGVKATMYTLLIWTLEISAVALVLISFGVQLPLTGYLLVLTLASLSTALPSGPAYVGPYQYAFILALGFFAISQEMALAISIAAQVSLLGSVTIIGVILLLREQLRTGPLPSRKKSETSLEKDTRINVPPS